VIPADPVTATLAGLCVFFVPGLVLLALLRADDRAALALDEKVFLMVAASVCAASWLALVLAEAGRFSLRTAGLLLLGVALLALLGGRRRLAGPFGGSRGGGRTLLPVLSVLAVSLFFQARPGEYLMGGRDPGVYIGAMALIGRTGGVAYVDPVVKSIPPQDVELFFRNPDNVDYSWGRFAGFPLERPETARVVPEFFHLFPAFGAYLFQSMGVKGALAAPCVFGVLGTLAVFFAWRRLFGPAPALLAGLLLAVNVLQVWFARYPVSEPMSQFLLFLGLWAFALWEERDSTVFGALAGIAFGLSFLVRIDSVLLAVPLGLYVLVRRLQGQLPWKRTLPVALPLGLLGLHALVHAAFWARKYLLDVVQRPYWNQPAWVWLAGTATVIVLILLAHRLERPALQWARTHGPLLQQIALGGLFLLALYAYLLRPYLSAWAGADGNDPTQVLAHPYWLQRLGFRRLAAHDAQSLVRLGWFVTPLGLGLGVLGLLNALRHWQRRFLLPVSLFLTFAFFYLYKIRIYNDYFFAMRRFVPVILPVLLGLAALFLCRLAARGRAARVAAGLLALTLGGLFLRESIPLLRYRDWKTAVSFVADMSRRFTPEDVVIFEQPQSIHLLALPLWAVHGENVIELARFNPDPVKLQHLVKEWRSRYRNIYFVNTYRTDLCGVFLERVKDETFGTYEWERTYSFPPRQKRAQSFRFTIWRVVPPQVLAVPALPEVDIGASDDFQVSGFFDKEGFGERNYRWTGACASVYLPGARGARRLSITASAGRRPPSLPAVVTASLAGRALGRFTLGSGWSTHTLDLPAALGDEPPVLRLDVAPWRPANFEPGSEDVRDLGVMVDRIRLE
jgi:hypothetical protein